MLDHREGLDDWRWELLLNNGRWELLLKDWRWNSFLLKERSNILIIIFIILCEEFVNWAFIR